MTYKGVQYAKMFSTWSEVRLVFWILPYLNILYMR